MSKRTFKFRCWHPKLNKFIYFKDLYMSYRMCYLLEASEGHISTVYHYWDTDNECIQQFIGLVDLNGKEIFEGDICIVDFNRCGTQICEIKYDQLSFKFFMYDGYAHTAFSPQFPILINDEYRFIEVIGNIFEKPDIKKYEKQINQI